MLRSQAPQQGMATERLVPTELWRTEAHGIRCLACARGCLLHDASVGYCTAMRNADGQLVSTAYGVIGEISTTPIENRPIYHYRPGSRTLCLGGIGCNLRCGFCQNWEVAFRDARAGGGLSAPNVLPERAVALAQQRYCAGLAWTFNEPSISPGYVLDCARLARAAGLYTVFVTNGLMTQEALSLLGPWLDVYRVDVKSLDAAFFQQVAATDRIAEVLPIARRAQQEFGIHVEVVTNLMPSLNESDEHLTRLAAAIVDHLGGDTPWHLTSYVPYAHMTHIAPTPPATLQRARTIGLRMGLRFIYTDDPTTPTAAHTYCPTCAALVIERRAHHVTSHALRPDGACANCGTALGIIV